MANIVITGCSSGFGFHGALAFARNGDQVNATMRNLDKAAPLREAAKAENLDINILELDVTRSETFPGFFEKLEKSTTGVNVLVNNAGILRSGALEDLDEKTIREVIETNLIGPLLLSRAVLPGMRSRKDGYIIMISSLSGIAGLPGDVTYTASKFALEGASEALRHEVDRWGIKLALVEAGMYATEILSESTADDRVLPAYYPENSPYQALIQSNLNGLCERKDEAFDPAIIAELMVKIAASDGSQLRWPADQVAEMVLDKMFAQNDSERDEFLRGVAGNPWWSAGGEPG